MNKKIVSLIIFVCLFCFASTALAVTLTDPLNGVKFPDLLKKIATAVGTLIAGIGTVMLIVAGFYFLTSAGSPERVGVAKKALTYAIIGIVVGLAASSIADWVANIAK